MTTLAPFPWDEVIFKAANGIGRSDLDYFCAWPTHFGNPVVFTAVALMFMLIWDDEPVPKKFFSILYSTFLASILAQILKILVHRPRPYVHYQEFIEAGTFRINALFGILATESAFPSGHTATIFAGITSLLLLYGRRFWWLYFAGLFIGFTRVYVGVHYPSDILAGAVLGMCCGWLSHKCLKMDRRPFHS